MASPIAVEQQEQRYSRRTADRLRRRNVQARLPAYATVVAKTVEIVFEVSGLSVVCRRRLKRTMSTT